MLKEVLIYGSIYLKVSDAQLDFTINLQKVTIIPTKCVKDQGFYKNAGVENVFNGYECDKWTTRHYTEYLDSHPKLFSKHRDDIYKLNMNTIKKHLSIGISIRRNAISLCNSMLTQGKYEPLLLLRYGLR